MVIRLRYAVGCKVKTKGRCAVFHTQGPLKSIIAQSSAVYVYTIRDNLSVQYNTIIILFFERIAWRHAKLDICLPLNSYACFFGSLNQHVLRILEHYVTSS